MSNVQDIKRTNKLVEWVIYTTILCGLLIFSGFVSDSGINRQRITQTELRVSIQNNSGSTTPYRAISIVSDAGLSNRGCGAINTTIYLVQYEKLVEIRFLNNLAYWNSYKRPGKLVRTPYWRRSYNESALNSLRG